MTVSQPAAPETGPTSTVPAPGSEGHVHWAASAPGPSSPACAPRAARSSGSDVATLWLQQTASGTSRRRYASTTLSGGGGSPELEALLPVILVRLDMLEQQQQQQLQQRSSSSSSGDVDVSRVQALESSMTAVQTQLELAMGSIQEMTLQLNTHAQQQDQDQPGGDDTKEPSLAEVVSWLNTLQQQIQVMRSQTATVTKLSGVVVSQQSHMLQLQRQQQDAVLQQAQRQQQLLQQHMQAASQHPAYIAAQSPAVVSAVASMMPSNLTSNMVSGIATPMVTGQQAVQAQAKVQHDLQDLQKRLEHAVGVMFADGGSSLLDGLTSSLAEPAPPAPVPLPVAAPAPGKNAGIASWQAARQQQIAAAEQQAHGAEQQPGEGAEAQEGGRERILSADGVATSPRPQTAVTFDVDVNAPVISDGPTIAEAAQPSRPSLQRSRSYRSVAQAMVRQEAQDIRGRLSDLKDRVKSGVGGGGPSVVLLTQQMELLKQRVADLEQLKALMEQVNAMNEALEEVTRETDAMYMKIKELEEDKDHHTSQPGPPGPPADSAAVEQLRRELVAVQEQLERLQPAVQRQQEQAEGMQRQQEQAEGMQQQHQTVMQLLQAMHAQQQELTAQQQQLQALLQEQGQQLQQLAASASAATAAAPAPVPPPPQEDNEKDDKEHALTVVVPGLREELTHVVMELKLHQGALQAVNDRVNVLALDHEQVRQALLRTGVIGGGASGSGAPPLEGKTLPIPPHAAQSSGGRSPAGQYSRRGSATAQPPDQHASGSGLPSGDLPEVPVPHQNGSPAGSHPGHHHSTVHLQQHASLSVSGAGGRFGRNSRHSHTGGLVSTSPGWSTPSKRRSSVVGLPGSLNWGGPQGGAAGAALGQQQQPSGAASPQPPLHTRL